MNPVEQMQMDFVARLQSLDYFGDIYVAAPRVWKEGDTIHSPKTIHDKIDKALTGLIRTGGKIGAAVRVFQPSFKVPKPNLPGPQGQLVLLARCETHPIFNFSGDGTNKYVSEIGFEVLRHGHGFRMGTAYSSLFADGDCFLPYYNNETKLMTVDILLTATCQVPPINGVQLPQIAVDGNTVTLANITPDADIWYVTDPAVYPAPGIPGAMKYENPFDVEDNTSIRWAAYKPGQPGSFIGFQTINPQ